MTESRIKCISALEVLDSRGNPTVSATVVLEDGSAACASVPSGASTGEYEALELRDGDDSRYGGKGVTEAVANVNEVIAPALVGTPASSDKCDRRMLALDGTDDKSSLGANAILSVSLAVARAGAVSLGLPLYRYLGGINACRLPVPMMNILNGGAHASNNIDVQEFMIVPEGFDTFADALRAGSEIYHALGSILKSHGRSTAVGDEGGFAPDLSKDEEALDYLCDAIEKAGYDTDRVKIALDAAASEWYEDGAYRLPKSGEKLNADELIAKWERLSEQYPIISIEDGLGENDYGGWTRMTERIGDKIMLVGDDLFVTNTKRLESGITSGAANAILIKPNQIGTLSETLEVMRLASHSRYESIVSHRSGDTEDATIADIAVGAGAGFIKTGAPCRGERVAKYNRLLKIEAGLAGSAVYSGTGI